MFVGLLFYKRNRPADLPMGLCFFLFFYGDFSLLFFYRLPILGTALLMDNE